MSDNTTDKNGKSQANEVNITEKHKLAGRTFRFMDSKVFPIPINEEGDLKSPIQVQAFAPPLAKKKAPPPTDEKN